MLEFVNSAVINCPNVIGLYQSGTVTGPLLLKNKSTWAVSLFLLLAFCFFSHEPPFG